MVENPALFDCKLACRIDYVIAGRIAVIHTQPSALPVDAGHTPQQLN